MNNKINRLLLTLIIGLFLINFIIAAEWDNIKNYDSSTKIVTIKNAYGLPLIGTDLATIKLEKNTDYCLVNCEAEMTLDLKADYSNPFSKLDFYNQFNMKKINLQEYKIYAATSGHNEKVKQSIIDEASCKINEKGINECSTKDTLVETWVWDYKEYNPSESLVAGVYHIKITGKKGIKDSIEWIPNYLGIDISEWAVWSAGLNVGLKAYYNMSSNEEKLQIHSTNTNLTTYAGTGGNFTSTGALLGQALSVSSGHNKQVAYNVSFSFVRNTTLIKDTSLVFWVKPRDITLRGAFIAPVTSAGVSMYLGTQLTTGKLHVEGLYDGYLNIDVGLANGQWSMISVVKNKTGGGVSLGTTCIQVNNSAGGYQTCFDNADDRPRDGLLNITYGTAYTDSESFDGLMDEFAWYNRTLTPVEIENFYNNGVGISYLSGAVPIINLINPVSNYKTFSKTIQFNCSSVDDTEIVNMTLIIDNKINMSQIGDTNNNLTLNKSVAGLTSGIHNWTCSGGDNDGNTVLGLSRNFTISDVFFENYQTYNNPVLSGTNQLFIINVTILSTNSLTSGYLYYNGTGYLGSFVNEGNNNYLISKTITIPNSSVENNYSFYWKITLNDGQSNYSTYNNQTADPIAIDDCLVYTILILNYTLYDQDAKTQIFPTGDELNSTIKLTTKISPYGGAENPIGTYSKIYSNKTSALVCVNDNMNSSNFRLDSSVQFSSALRETQFHNIQNFLLNNNTIPQKIALYDLLSSRSQVFTINYKDRNFLGVSGALVNIARQYLDDNLFRSVEIPKTDDYGTVSAHLVLNSEIYQITVTKEGSVLAVYNNVIPICLTPTYTGCIINLNELSTTTNPTDYSSSDNVVYYPSFNEGTRTVSATFSTIDGSITTLTLNTTKADMFGTTQVCSDTLTSSSGALTCVIPNSYGNVTVNSLLYKSGKVISRATYSINEDSFDTGDYTGIVLTIFMFMTLTLMFISDGIGIIIGGVLGLFLAGLLTLFSLGNGFTGIASSILWLLCALGLVIWKINQRWRG